MSRQFKVLNLILVSVLLFSTQNISAQAEDKDYNTCLTKVNYKWGAECKGCTTGGKTYKVWFVNSCDEKLAVKIAVQEEHKRWKTFVRLMVLPKDTISGFACAGTGKYLYWTKKSDDNTLDFPSDEKINSEHTK